MKNLPFPSLTSLFAILAVMGFSASATQAQTTFQWDPSHLGGNGSDVNGTWDAGTTANWTQGSTTPVVWGNSTSDIANFGSSATASATTVTLASSVNAGGINFDDASTSVGYTLQSSGGGNKTITSAASTFNVSFANSTFFTRNAINNINFTGSSTYQFVGSSNTGAGVGANTSGDSFAGNVVLGLLPGTSTGTIDSGTVEQNSGSLVTSGKTVQINQSWTMYLSNTSNETDNFMMDGLGNRENGALSFGSGGTFSGTIQLLSDSTVFAGSAGASNVTASLTGVVSGSANLTLGFWNGSSNSTGLSKLVVGNASSSYTGATIIINEAGGIANQNNVALAQRQRVALGVANGLPSGTTLVLGDNGNTAAVTGAVKLNTEGSGVGGSPDMIGVFDLNGLGLSVAGLTTGAGLSTADAALNIIGNGGGLATTAGTGNAVLTINGGTGGTQASTYAGVIQDNFAASGVTSDATETSTFGLAVTGGSENLTGVNNTYSGGTTVSGGTLFANNASGSATGSGAVTVNGTGTIAGGTTKGDAGATSATKGGSTYGVFAAAKGFVGSGGAVTTVSGGGVLAPGNSGVGTLTFSNLTLSSGAVANFEFDSTSSTNDFASVTSALSLSSGIVFNLYQAGTTTAFGTVGAYDLIGYGTDSGFSASDFSVANTVAGRTYTFVDDKTDKVIQLDIGTATPEPGTWAMLLGGLALLGFVIRRRSFNS